MKKWLYIAIAAVILAVVAVMWGQSARINKLKNDRDKYRTNTEVLLKDVERYQTKDSLSAAKVGAMELKLSEMEKYRADDMALINTLHVKNKELEAVTTAQMETITELKGRLKDTIVYVPAITPIDKPKAETMQTLDINEKWFELHGIIDGFGNFTGDLINRDSLLIAVSVEYKRFLGFLWRTDKVKKRDVDVVSKNPNTQIMGFEYVEIRK